MNLRRISNLIQIGRNYALNSLLTTLSVKTGRSLSKPVHVYWIITGRCNYRCPMCIAPTFEEDKADILREDEIRSMMKELSEWGIKSLGISGGEPLIYRSKLLFALKEARARGIFPHFVTNASLLDKAFLEEFDSYGGGYITLSLDGSGEVHDRMRGIEGAFDRCLAIMEMMKDGAFGNISLKLNTVLTEVNLEGVLQVAKLGVDYGYPVYIQPYDVIQGDSPSGSDEKRSSGRNRLEEDPFWVKEASLPRLDEVVEELIALKKANPKIILNYDFNLKAIPEYFRGKLTREGECLVGYKVLWIGSKGDLFMCPFRSNSIGNLRSGGIKKNWTSAAFSKERRAMTHCKRDCLTACLSYPDTLTLVREGLRVFKAFT